LPGVGAVIFDEFHERALAADLGLALCLEVRGALRPDLALIVMSATLDAGPVAALMGDAPVITSEGRAYPVETRYAPTRRGPRARIGPWVAEAVREALAEAAGGVLVFLPGAGEIGQVERALGDLGPGVEVRPLYGAMPIAAQRAAIRAAPEDTRKVVLATSIAETSLTIEDVRVVIDAGLARRSRFDAGSGMARLITERVTRAEADQRRGRAGRVAEGVCYRLWTKGEDGALAAFPPPEIDATDLAPLALALARWGAADVPFLTPPPAPALAEARALLRKLGALDEGDRITQAGQAMAQVPAHPRIAHMLRGARGTAALAACLSVRDPLMGGAVDLGLRLRALEGRDGGAGVNAGALAELRAEAKRLKRFEGDGAPLSPGAALSLAYPDRIALRRKGEAPRYLMSGGKGAVMPSEDALAGQRLLVIADLDGDLTEAKVRRALPVSEGELRALHAVEMVELCTWSRRHRRVEARHQVRLGAIALEDQIWSDVPPERRAAAALDGVRDLGLDALGWSAAARRFQARVAVARGAQGDLPDLSDSALMDGLADWLLPYLGAVRSAEDLKRLDPLPALEACLDWDQRQTLDARAPKAFTAPTGTRVPVDYSDPEAPSVAVRLQELFGVAAHPTIGPNRVPLRLDLLSPAQRVVQTTSDLPGFWASSYADVRKDMRGRYPRHPWPEDPLTAPPTRRATPRKTK
ncbi:MAG: ATP-dependent helicase HrpB, partial [Pseudomonadota bacterium]